MRYTGYIRQINSIVKLLLSLLLSLSSGLALAQYNSFESRLPLIIIDSHGQTIYDEPKITAHLKIINNPSSFNRFVDEATDYDGFIGIEIRGASSSRYPQTPYLLETRDSLGENNNVPLLGMPEENDWVLLSNYNDKSFLRNMLAFHLFEQMGHYAPRMKLCEVFIDNDYKGIYLFGEKIKRDKNRVDIARLNPDENEGEDLTGGYIFKVDYRDGDDFWVSQYSPPDHPDFKIRFIHYYPKSDDITFAQKNYIKSFVDDFEDALYTKSFTNSNGYRSFINDTSFMDYFILNEVARNNDGFKKSRYFHKDKNGLINAGPVWDFDWAWKNISECPVVSATNGSGWAHHINDCNPGVKSPGWMIKILQDTSFANQVDCRYKELRTNILSDEYIFNFIDSVASTLDIAQTRHFQKYKILGKNVGAPEVDPQPASYEGEVEKLKNWISMRLRWLDGHMVGNCGGETAEQTDELLVIYPNPSSGDIKINSKKDIKGIEIYNLTGTCLDKRNLYSKELITLKLSHLQKGIYLIRVNFTDGNSASSKIVLQ